MNGDTLLQAIIDDPADDLPRLAFADWLEEQGTDYAIIAANLIRKQIANPESQVDVPIWHPAVWVNMPHGAKVQFHRGFIEWCSMTMKQWLLHGPLIVTRHPIGMVSITDRAPRIWANISTLIPQYAWVWRRGEDYVLPYHIDEVFPFANLRQRGAGIAKYNTSEMAMKDLGRACILWAKHAAGGKQQ